MLDTNIVLIGPSGAGKTTLAKLLGTALNVPSLDLDDLRKKYYLEMDYDNDEAERIRAERGMPALAAYWKPFEIYSVERLIEDYPTGHVIAFGAGQSVYDDSAQFERARTALASYPVILLLPSPDKDQSIPILNARIHASEPDLPEAFFGMIDEMNRQFIEHPSNIHLATRTIYTAGKSPQETCAEIIATLNLRGA